jgi:hypothetical protein
VKVGDLVRIKSTTDLRTFLPEVIGKTGVVVATDIRRGFIPQVKVWVDGHHLPFDHDEVRVLNESR